jgi:hypothetical protein
MSEINFSAMTDAQLRAYVLKNRQDTTAFHAYVDRMQQRPPVAVIEPEEWSEERMAQALNEIKQRSDRA